MMYLTPFLTDKLLSVITNWNIIVANNVFACRRIQRVNV